MGQSIKVYAAQSANDAFGSREPPIELTMLSAPNQKRDTLSKTVSLLQQAYLTVFSPKMEA